MRRLTQIVMGFALFFTMGVFTERLIPAAEKMDCTGTRPDCVEEACYQQGDCARVVSCCEWWQEDYKICATGTGNCDDWDIVICGYYREYVGVNCTGTKCSGGFPQGPALDISTSGCL